MVCVRRVKSGMYWGRESVVLPGCLGAAPCGMLKSDAYRLLIEDLQHSSPALSNRGDFLYLFELRVNELVVWEGKKEEEEHMDMDWDAGC